MDNGIQEVKSRLNIIEVIGDYLPLKQSGNAFWGRCPFHKEKTPSFSVSPDRQTFHCFGCGKGGDVFTFLMEIENIDFRDALMQLAGRAGVDLQPFNAGSRPSQKKSFGDILETALQFYRQNLSQQQALIARSYLEQRSLSSAACAEFELGWAPVSWDELVRTLREQGVPENEQIESGLVVRGDHGLYDRFRGRIMFPIRDDRRRLVGFGGRLVSGDGAKYVNSPEGVLFNKRRLLYLLGHAKKKIRESGRLILVEGYLDAIRAHLFGFQECVASLGTALTDEQGALIKRFSDLCYICYDPDSAGQEAALRGMYVLQKCGVEVRVVSLPGGKDPDEIFLQPNGTEIFESALKRGQPLARYHAMVRKNDLQDPAKQLRAREDLLEGLASLPVLDVVPHLGSIAQLFGVLPHELQREIAARRLTAKKENYRSSEKEEAFAVVREEFSEEKTAEVEDLECVLCSFLWSDASLRAKIEPKKALLLFTDEVLKNIALALLSGESPEELQERWRQISDEECTARIARGNAVIAREGLDETASEGLILLLERRNLERRYAELKKRMLCGEATTDDLEQYQLYARKLKGGG
ncbi:MAG: DNA primase [Synergistaceae bacterium]|nr:DNA primase [Synergistaceae bacterium]MBP9957245.1 DNA primase [Synergistaceae bacterium]